jgi:hypothetical protein
MVRVLRWLGACAFAAVPVVVLVIGPSRASCGGQATCLDPVVNGNPAWVWPTVLVLVAVGLALLVASAVLDLDR